jgi:hypothetical protein
MKHFEWNCTVTFNFTDFLSTDNFLKNFFRYLKSDLLNFYSNYVILVHSLESIRMNICENLKQIRQISAVHKILCFSFLKVNLWEMEFKVMTSIFTYILLYKAPAAYVVPSLSTFLLCSSILNLFLASSVHSQVHFCANVTFP